MTEDNWQAKIKHLFETVLPPVQLPVLSLRQYFIRYNCRYYCRYFIMWFYQTIISLIFILFYHQFFFIEINYDPLFWKIRSLYLNHCFEQMTIGWSRKKYLFFIQREEGLENRNFSLVNKFVVRIELTRKTFSCLSKTNGKKLCLFYHHFFIFPSKKE